MVRVQGGEMTELILVSLALLMIYLKATDPIGVRGINVLLAGGYGVLAGIMLLEMNAERLTWLGYKVVK